MPRRVSESELVAILEVVRGFPGPVSIEEIGARLADRPPRRTLQRRLAALVREGRLQGIGERGGRRYALPPSAPLPVRVREDSARPATDREREHGGISLSPEAEEIRRRITRPLAHRKPVGYDPAFLESYHPNKTAYLSRELRGELADTGRVGIADLPAGTYLRQVLDRLLIDLSWNSSRLEGNTYSLLETERLLERGESAGGKADHESQMILNHKAAIEMLAEQAEEIGFNRYTICNLHALLSDNLLADPAACGLVRSRAVGITGTVFYPLEAPEQIDARFHEILAKAEAIEDPFEQAFFVMVQLPYLQPFEDVNKRVSRLAANIPMIKRNLCPLSFIDVPREDYVNGIVAVYELNRIEYLRDVFAWAYRRSCARYSAVRQSLGEPDPFRMRYRTQIGALVREVVAGGPDKSDAAKRIAARSEKEIPPADRAKFIEIVETELGCLHEGNIARYRLRPGEFDDWKRRWR